MEDAVRARDNFARWASDTFEVPVFLYGPEKSLPYVRRHAFADIQPDMGPAVAHPRAGAVCVGVRNPLVAYNVWLRDNDVATARAVAAAVRNPSLRTLGLQVGERVQVSMNLVEPMELGPMQAFDAVSELAPTDGAELVGLVPRGVLDGIPASRWGQLDVSLEQTIEFRLAERAMRRA